MTGVELLRHRSDATPSNVLRRKSSPFVATLLSFVPGLGAAYNGQTSKAIVHFAIFASFFQMAVLTQGVHFFILGVLGSWLFAAVDACRTAQLMRAGLATDAEEDVIARRLYGNPFAWGLTLIVIGTLFLLHTLLGDTCSLITFVGADPPTASSVSIHVDHHRQLFRLAFQIQLDRGPEKQPSLLDATLLRCRSSDGRERLVVF